MNGYPKTTLKDEENGLLNSERHREIWHLLDTGGDKIKFALLYIFVVLFMLLRKASEARVNRRLRLYYLIVRLLPNVFSLACLPLSSI